jgi:hypothetical protein
MRKILVVTVLLAAMVETSVSMAEDAPKFLQLESSQSTKATNPAASAPSVSAASASGTPQTWDWIPYSQFWCDVDWIHFCNGPDLVITAPSGWQACKALYTVARNDGYSHSYKVTSSNWYVNNPLEPASFRTYTYSLYAAGNGNPFSPQGANVTLTNVGMRLIKGNATYTDRFAAQCDLPPTPSP